MNEKLKQPVDRGEQIKQGVFLEMFGLNAEQMEILKGRVKQADGLVRVFVHPMATDQVGENIENQERVFQFFARTVNSDEAPPVIILENRTEMDHWPKDEGEFSEGVISLPYDVYVVHTLLHVPYPIVPGKPIKDEVDSSGRLTDESFEYAREGFTKFVEFLDSIGVRKVLVGGTSLVIEHDYIAKCVGNFINFMDELSTIDVKLSLGTAPLNRTDLKKLRPDLM